MGVCAPFKQIFKTDLIESLYNSFNVLNYNSYLIGIGKPTTWINLTGQNVDSNPPKPIDSIKAETDFWRQVFAFKKVYKDDVCLVIPRYDWERGKIYDTYRDYLDLYDDINPKIFYVLVDDERVYKCIDNNNRTPSTVAPTHTDPQIRTLSDGYRWKFLYSIPDSKRKFLTVSKSGILGYMPVEFLQNISQSDERILQFDVQSSAVTGSIDYIELDPLIKSQVISNRAVFPSTENQVAVFAPAGATTITIGGPNIILSNNYYNNFVIKFDSGVGAGQQRIIKQYSAGANTATVILDSALDVSITGGNGSDLTRYSIFPYIKIVGDGSSNNNALNKLSTIAEVSAKFGNDFIFGITGAKYLDSIEMVDQGKNYSYADIEIVSGLTTIPGSSLDLKFLAKAIMSPFGGHGSNPVKELGCSALMIVLNFNQTELGKISTANEFRQFSLAKNCSLYDSHAYLRLSSAGLSASFVVGNIVSQGKTGSGGTSYTISQGKILEWNKGTLSTTGTSELVLTDITGNFELGGWINGLSAFEISHAVYKSIAGREGRELKTLRVVPITGSFFANGTDYTPGYVALGNGLSSINISRSDSTGRIYRWEPDLATNSFGTLSLEYPNGNFNLGEIVNYSDPRGISSVQGNAKITEINENYIGQSVYDQTYNFYMGYDGVVIFDKNSFIKDSLVNGYKGLTSFGTGLVIEWTSITGGTSGYLRILPQSGKINLAEKILYNNSVTGSSILNVLSKPEVKYKSGDLLYLQNLREISRSPEQKEEIKLVIEF